MVNEKIYKGQKYDYDYMMEKVELYPKLKKKLEQAKDELESAKESYIKAKEDLEDIELEWQNYISEWEGFKPFEDKLKQNQEIN